jgi:hypothetical protein
MLALESATQHTIGIADAEALQKTVLTKARKKWGQKRTSQVHAGRLSKAVAVQSIGLTRPLDPRRNSMKPMNLRKFAGRDVARTLVKAALISGVLVTFGLGAALGEPIDKKGTTPYVTHFIFRPLMNIDVPGLGTATHLEAIGTTQNMKGEKMLDKMSARCAALSVASGSKKYIDGACVLADSDGDKIFSTFDTRDVDQSQPSMNCGTHIITGGTGKYAGITGSEPFACITMPALAGPGDYTAMDIPHNTSWEVK